MSLPSVKRLFSVGLLSVALFIVLSAIKTQYFLVVPGTAEDVLPMILISKKHAAYSGHLYLTTVYAARADLLMCLFGKMDPWAELVRVPGLSGEEEHQVERAMMEESQLAAEVVALRAAGFSAKLQGEGVRVLQMVKGSHAEGPVGAEGPGRAVGLLRPGDVILEIDRHPTPLVSDLIDYLNGKKPGTVVELHVIGNGKERSVRVKSKSRKGKARLGILVAQNGLKLESPVPIQIKAGDVEGGSAGLMFALGIYDLLKGGGLLHGQPVAGTGTIELNGSVGEIEGVRQKMEAARKAGAKIFFCPVENYAEASRRADGLTVVPVRNFSQALHYLEELR